MIRFDRHGRGSNMLLEASEKKRGLTWIGVQNEFGSGGNLDSPISCGNVRIIRARVKNET